MNIIDAMIGTVHHSGAFVEVGRQDCILHAVAEVRFALAALRVSGLPRALPAAPPFRHLESACQTRFWPAPHVVIPDCRLDVARLCGDFNWRGFSDGLVPPLHRAERGVFVQVCD